MGQEQISIKCEEELRIVLAISLNKNNLARKDFSNFNRFILLLQTIFHLSNLCVVYKIYFIFSYVRNVRFCFKNFQFKIRIKLISEIFVGR